MICVSPPPAKRCGLSSGAEPDQMIIRKTGYCILLLTLIFFGQVADSAAQEDRPVNIEAQLNVPYVVQFGFGSYDIGGLSANTYRIPLTHTFTLGAEKDAWRLTLTGYLGYCHINFETRLLGPKLTATQEYAFVLPHVELQIPLQQGWVIKPYLAAGFGYAFNGSVALEGYGKESLNNGYDFLYTAGVSNLVVIPLQEFSMSFGTRLGWAEEKPFGGGKSQGFATFQTGLEARHPIGLSLMDHPLDLAGSFIYYKFFPAAQFTIPNQSPLEVSNQYEFGTDLGFAKPTRLWIFDNPRIGISYRFGDGLEGFRVNMGFPF